MTGLTDAVDALPVKGVTDSEATYDRIAAIGCAGGKTTAEDCVSNHRGLVPAKRRLAVASQGGRGTRFRTGSGEALQMDWGLTGVGDWAVGCVPAKTHAEGRVPACAGLEQTGGVAMCLCPRRRIGFDGLASHEGRGFGAPHWCPGKACRVDREGGRPHACSEGLSRGPAVRPVTWGRKGGFRDGQCAGVQPVELPAAQAKATIARPEPTPTKRGSEKFGLGRWA